ncbi:uncharacterized protein LOC108665399 [Hyalella azteca]|uniref:Uncharacterized protein LOC108665399 n=1 Tax=Hyalella azteca TaxID=294128 RepID=A0A8B7N2H0_HYAAZ|nr:uncharacterized protein LOC108665399 [Hyalella azteca]
MKGNMFVSFTCIIFSCVWTAAVNAKQETWRSDLSDAIQIGVSSEGFSRAVVDCGDQEMAFVISLDEEFDGVLYTRGSFSSKNTNCFRKANGGKDFALKFSYNECGVKFDAAAGGDTTTVIVQFDDDLIFPGDLAFAIICNRTAPRLDDDNDEESDLPMRSRITLVAADPGAQETGSAAVTSSSTSQVATLYPPEPKSHQEL